MRESNGYGNRGLSSQKLGQRCAAMVRELIAERVRQHLTQQQVIDAMGGGWRVDTLSVVERGVNAPSAEFLILWAEALGRPLTLGGPS